MRGVKKRFSFQEILSLIIICLLSIVIVVLLGLWTHSIRKADERKLVQNILSDIVNRDGEKEIFELAGIPVDEIYYSDALLPLYNRETPAWSYTADEARSMAIYKLAKDSVVQIQSLSELSDSGQGSGVVISQDGYIVTNKHVIGSGDKFNVNFSSGSSMVAKLVGYDNLTDIALIKVEGKNLEHITFGSCDSLVVGQSVWAIGNPYGYTWSFTTGMISGLDRMVSTSDGNVIPNMIQTDAMINPGNSGGPLLNGKGEMIGLVSSIYSTSGSAQGISFALPVEVVAAVVEQILKNGSVKRGWLDILSVELNAQIVSYSSLNVGEGILVSQVVPAGKADKAGIKGGKEKAQYGQSVIYLSGDVIVQINGHEIKNYVDYFSALFSSKPGDKVDIVVNRKGQNILIKDVELIEQTEENIKWILR